MAVAERCCQPTQCGADPLAAGRAGPTGWRPPQSCKRNQPAECAAGVGDHFRSVLKLVDSLRGKYDVGSGLRESAGGGHAQC
jgi:hypothetical protein